MPSGKWRERLKDSAPEGPLDVRTPEELEFERAQEEARRKAAERAAQAAEADAAERERRKDWRYPKLPRDKYREVVDDHAEEHAYQYGDSPAAGAGVSASSSSRSK